MKKTLSRFLALVLALMLCVGSLPAKAFAEGPSGDDTSSVTETGSVGDEGKEEPGEEQGTDQVLDQGETQEEAQGEAQGEDPKEDEDQDLSEEKDQAEGQNDAQEDAQEDPKDEIQEDTKEDPKDEIPEEDQEDPQGETQEEDKDGPKEKTGDMAFTEAVSNGLGTVPVITNSARTVDNGGSVNLPVSGTDTLDLSDQAAGFSFRVYDNGGSSNYSDDCDGSLIILAPENCVLSLTGSGYTEEDYDELYLYDSDTTTLLGQSPYSGSISISQFFTTSNVLKIRFKSDGGTHETGFQLNVTITEGNSSSPITLHTVSYAYNGTTKEADVVAEGSSITLATFSPMFTLPDRKQFNGWRIGESETLYAAGDSFTVTEDVIFDAVVVDAPVIEHSDAYPNYARVPQTGTLTADLSGWQSGRVLYVFDDGGPNANYPNYCDGYLRIVAPANYILRVSGSGNSESKSYDYLILYDGDTQTQLGNGKYGGRPFTVDELFTTGSVLRVYFKSDYSDTYAGFSLRVTVVDTSNMATLSFDAGEGSGEMDSITVVPGDTVTVPTCTFTPPENQLFSHYTDGTNSYRPGDEITLTGNKTLTAVYAATVTVTYVYGEQTHPVDMAQGSEITLPAFTSLFTLPERKVFEYWQCGETHYNEGDPFTVNQNTTFTAVLTDEPVILHGEEGTAYASYANYALLPKTINVTADLSGESAGYTLWVFDDGGLNGNYSNVCDGSITVIAPAGMRLRIESDVKTEENYDYLKVYDGASAEANVLGGPYSGTKSFGPYTNTALYSTGNAVTIFFHSNGWSNYRGIDMKVTVFDPSSLVKITFDPGEGSGTMDDIVLLSGDTVYLPNCGFTLPPKTYFDYYTDGTNRYSQSQSVTVTADLHLTAVYIEKIYFTYTNGLTQIVQECRKGRSPSLPSYTGYGMFSNDVPYRKQFRAWSCNGTEYQVGYSYYANEDTTFTAVFDDLPILQSDNSGGYYVVMPRIENVPVSLADQSNGFTFTLYDNAGSSTYYDYANNCDGSLTFTAPAGYVFAVTGSGIIESYNNTKNDWLRIYDSDGTTVLGDDPYGGAFTISDELITTSNTLKAVFHSDSNGTREGFALTVKMYDPTTRRTITFLPGEGGSGEMAPVFVLSDVPYTLPACDFDAPSGQVIFAGWKDENDNTYQPGDQHTFTENTTLTAQWAERTGVTYQFGESTRAFEVPKGVAQTLPTFESLFTLPSYTAFRGWKERVSGDVYQPGDSYTVNEATVFDAFMEQLPVVVQDADDNWYANMPTTGTVTADVTDKGDGFTFTVYDDGGKDGNYSNSCNGTLVIQAAPGMLIKVSGTMNTESGYDYLSLIDDSYVNTSKYLLSPVSGSGTIDKKTTGNYLTIWFRSDSSTNYTGFALTVTLEMQAAITYVYGENSKIVSFTPGQPIALEKFEDLFTLPEGYEFICWRDENDVAYAEGQEITPAGTSLILTAELGLMPKVTLDGNGAILLAAYGGDGTITVSPAFPVPKNKPMALPNANQFFEVPEGKVFGGWLYNGTRYDVADELSTDVDVTLTAVWVDPSPWDILAATLAAAASGTDLGTIELTSDLIGGTGSDILTLPEGVTATIDLKGYAIDGTATAKANERFMINVLGTLTIVDSVGGGSITGGIVQVFGNEGLTAPESVLSCFAAGVELDYSVGEVWTRYVALYFPTVKEAMEIAYGIGTYYETQLPAHDSSETYVFLLADATIPVEETWEVSTGYDWINLDLNGHTFNVLGTLKGGHMYVDSVVPGAFNSSGTIELYLSPYTADTYSFSDGVIDRDINARSGSFTISGGTFNGEFSLSGGTCTVSDGTFKNEFTVSDGVCSITGGTFEEEFTAFGGVTEITGGTFVDWVNFDNYYGGPVLSISGVANLGGLYFDIYDEDSPAAKLTVSGNACIAEMDFDLPDNWTAATKPTMTLAGGYYGNASQINEYKDPRTWPAALGGAVEIAFSGPVEEYAGQADWAYSGADYPWRISASAALQFYGASLTLQNNLRINYVVRKDLIENNGYSDPYVVFEMNGAVTTVSTYSEIRSDNLDYYCFRFSNISPDKMNDEITATLHATANGMAYASAPFSYSIATYCYSQLGKTTDGYLRTLLVDLLNYGAAAQTYTNYKVDTPVNARLTEEQRSWGTADAPDLSSVTDPKYRTVTSPAVNWTGVSLLLNDSITMQFVFTADDVTGLTIRIEDTNGTILKEIPASSFVASGSNYIARFRGLNAGEMKKTVLATAYLDGTAVSNTLAYSIESYVCAKQNSTYPHLADMVIAMIKYGNSAYAYAHKGDA